METLLKHLGLERETLGVRMTGCPNGCVRPYQSDIGIVGRSGDKYVLYVGGRVHGDRMNFQLKDLVPRGEIVATLEPLLRRFREERRPDESFGDYCHRLGAEHAARCCHTVAVSQHRRLTTETQRHREEKKCDVFTFFHLSFVFSVSLWLIFFGF